MAARGRRAAAKTRGEKQYFTGVPCTHGHIAARRTANGQCAGCQDAWLRENPERRRETTRKYRHTNPNQSKEWKERNPERVRDKMREWRARNPHKVDTYQSRYRARKFNAPVGDREAYEKYVAWARTAKGLCCAYCNEPVEPEKRHIDHVVPLSKGGADSVENLCVACADCNHRKHTKTVQVFEEHQRRLREEALAGLVNHSKSAA